MQADAVATAIENARRALDEQSLPVGAVCAVWIEDDAGPLLAAVIGWRGEARDGWPVAECFLGDRMPSFYVGRHELLRAWRPGPLLVLRVGSVGYLLMPPEA